MAKSKKLSGVRKAPSSSKITAVVPVVKKKKDASTRKRKQSTKSGISFKGMTPEQFITSYMRQGGEIMENGLLVNNNKIRIEDAAAVEYLAENSIDISTLPKRCLDNAYIVMRRIVSVTRSHGTVTVYAEVLGGRYKGTYSDIFFSEGFGWIPVSSNDYTGVRRRRVSIKHLKIEAKPTNYTLLRFQRSSELFKELDENHVFFDHIGEEIKIGDTGALPIGSCLRDVQLVGQYLYCGRPTCRFRVLSTEKLINVYNTSKFIKLAPESVALNCLKSIQ